MKPTTILGLSAETSEERFDRFYREHYRLVYRAAYAVTGNREDAEDVLQDLFVSLLARWVQVAEMENPKGYLHRSAVHQAHKKNRSRQRDNIIENLDGVPESELPSSAMDSEIQDQLLNAMALLKPADAEMLILTFLHGYSAAEMARIVDKSQSAVSVNLFRARTRLKKLMSRQGAKR